MAMGSCRDTDNSKLSGHWEDYNSETLAKFKGNQMVVPEYEPSQGVIISLKMLTKHHLESMALHFLKQDITSLWVIVPLDYSPEEEARDLNVVYESAGSNRSKIKVVHQAIDGELREWSRDWAPLTARGKGGEIRFLDFNYYPRRPADDSVPTSLGQVTGVERLSIPVYNEGGNFMINSRGHCMMSDRVVASNSKKSLDDDIILDAQEIKEYYLTYAGCKTVTIFPSLPFEGTRHIDLWAKFMSDDTIIVGELRDEILAIKHYSSKQVANVAKMQTYLNDRAQDLRQMGYNIVRVPMPAPTFEPGFTDAMNRSYINSLLLNGTVYIPQYQRPALGHLMFEGEYIDKDLIQKYDNEVFKIHKTLGYKVVWIPSDTMIVEGGAVHCTTMQVAAR